MAVKKMMGRYKPVGWRNESYRHYLAAKGVKTRFYARRLSAINPYTKSAVKIREEIYGKEHDGRGRVSDDKLFANPPEEWRRLVEREEDKTFFRPEVLYMRPAIARADHEKMQFEKVAEAVERARANPEFKRMMERQKELDEADEVLEAKGLKGLRDQGYYSGKRYMLTEEEMQKFIADEKLREDVKRSAIIAEMRSNQKILGEELDRKMKDYEEAKARGEVSAPVANSEIRRALHSMKVISDRIKDEERELFGYYARKTVMKKGTLRTTKSGEEVQQIAYDTMRALRPYMHKGEITGSIRRKRKDPTDVDIVVVPRGVTGRKKMRDLLKERSSKVYQDGTQKFAGNIDGVKTEVIFARPEEYGAQLMYNTGPVGANIYNRKLAKSKGMKLSQHGLFKGDRRIAVGEHSIYRALGKSYRPPETRGTPR